jgi:hypothetical protein
MTPLARTLLTVVLMVTASLEGAPVLAQATAPSQSAPARTEPARAGSTPTADPHRQQDVARHRAMAAAHEASARCLEAGERESVCQDRLRKACEGIAIGRYCGMKHGH